MKVVVMRHGEAEGINVIHRFKDSARNLTENGRSQAVHAAQKLANNPLGLTIKEVIASDFNRATQTGSIVSSQLGIPFRNTPDLGLDSTNLIAVELLLAELSQTYANDEAVVLVSHIPLVFQLSPNNAVHSWSTASFLVYDYETKLPLISSHQI